MRGTTFLDAGILAHSDARCLIQEVARHFSVKVEVKEIKWLLRSRFYITFDGEEAYRAYEALKRACEEE